MYLDKDFVFNYKAVADSEKVIRGNHFIKNGDKLEGTLCINHDTWSWLMHVQINFIRKSWKLVNILGIDAAFCQRRLK